MAKRYAMISAAVLILASSLVAWVWAGNAGQDNSSVIRVTVAMVQLNVAVTDNKGNYVTGLRPSDFVLSEDGIPQNVATFEEGNEGPRSVSDVPSPEQEHTRREPPRSGAQTDSLEGIA